MKICAFSFIITTRLSDREQHNERFSSTSQSTHIKNYQDFFFARFMHMTGDNEGMEILHLHQRRNIICKIEESKTAKLLPIVQNLM